MSRSRFSRLSFGFCLSFAFCVAAAPGPAGSAVPDPASSEAPDCLVFCPAGDTTHRVVVRDFGRNPIAGSVVVLDFSACPRFAVCEPRPGDPYAVDAATRTVRAITDAFGVARFPVRMGGTCARSTVRVFADGVLLRLSILASPDQDGDLAVTEIDTAIVRSKVGTSDGTGDLDCDGFVADDDVEAAAAHLEHACDRTTRLRRSGWGELKLHYR